ncbi:MAG TPA: endolytic transglycosylase MltG [Armatimonadota bacterium]|jgi:UPF0755 protein
MPSSPISKKRRTPSPWKLLFLTLALFVGLSLSILWAFLPKGGDGKLRLVVIPRGSSTREIGRRLKDQGIIRSAWAFVILSKVLGDSQGLQSGDYRLSPELSLAQILRKLASGDAVNRWVTVPEGYTVKQIAEVLQSEGRLQGDRFRRIARVGGRTFRPGHFTPPGNLEGYLYPDTYKLPRRASERAVLAAMLGNFDRKVVVPLGQRLRSNPYGLDLRQVVTLASIIEREAKVPDDRPRIAGVLLNRLKRDMPLQVDATVQFALGFNRPKLFFKDLKVVSPYNTYLHKGLPPGPICNPGIASLRAILYPDTHDYLYYVARSDGSHVFTRTVEEHARAIRETRAQRAAASP